MSAGFGFSIGDFLAALKVISDVIDALRDSGNSSTECRQLLRQLLDLETALIHVKRLDPDETQSDQLNALRRSASQCRITIDEFMTKIHKYQPHLYQKGLSTTSVFKQSWYKIKWALCHKEDVEKLKADLAGHTEAINILMNAIQIEKMTLQSRTNATQHLTLKSIIQDCYSRTMQKLSVIGNSIAASVSNSIKLLEITAHTAQIYCKIFWVVLDIQDMLRKAIAPQILRSQPVYFIDALGAPAPFYLEFVRSSEAFLAVLRCNLEGNDSAVARIDRGDFVITDIASKRDVDLRRPWQICFRPGQQVDMSMILNDRFISSSTCPNCETECAGNCNQDTICVKCGLTFRRFTDLTAQDNIHQYALLNSSDGEPKDPGSETSFGPEPPSRKRRHEEDAAQELMMYRKVRLRQNSIIDREEAVSIHLEQRLKDKEYMKRFEDRFADQPEMYTELVQLQMCVKKERRPIADICQSVDKLLLGCVDLQSVLKQFVPGASRHLFEEPTEKANNKSRIDGARRQRQYARSAHVNPTTYNRPEMRRRYAHSAHTAQIYVATYDLPERQKEQAQSDAINNQREPSHRTVNTNRTREVVISYGSPIQDRVIHSTGRGEGRPHPYPQTTSHRQPSKRAYLNKYHQ